MSMFVPRYNLKEQQFNASSVSVYNAQNDLYAWYKFDQDISTKGNLLDSSGNGRELSPKSDPSDRPLAPTADSPGQSLGFPERSAQFDNDLLTNDNDADFVFPEGFTVSVWVKFSDLSTNHQVLVAQTSDNNTGGEYSMNFRFVGSTYQRLYLYVGEGGTGSGAGFLYAYSSQNVLTADQWHHVTATYGGGTDPESLDIYVDGVSVKQSALVGSSFNGLSGDTNGRFVVGNWLAEHISYDLIGAISELAVWSRGLTSSEIAGLYTLASAAYGIRSRRVYEGFKTRGSRVKLLSVEGEMNNDYTLRDDYIREGRNVLNRHEQRFLTHYLKSNISDVVLYDGKEMGEKFDDAQSPVSYDVNNSTGFYFFGTPQRVPMKLWL